MIIYGAGGHAKVIIDCLESCEQPIELIIDDDKNKTKVLNYPVSHIYDQSDIPHSSVLIAIGNNKIRKSKSELISHKTGTVIHPTASVSSYASIGSGTVVFHKAIVQANAMIGQHVIINTSSIIEHDCIVKNFAHIAPNSTLCGEVVVGEGTLVGAGAVILPGVKIGNWCTIGAGCIIKNDVPDNTIVKPVISEKKTSLFSLHKPYEIYLSPPHMSGKERQCVDEVFASNWIAPKGEALDQFENKLCKVASIQAAAALNSGTAALHLALVLLGIGEGDEVICPTFTFAATANPILYQKAVPIFIDCEPASWNMDLAEVKKAIEDRIRKGNKPKAIIAVHNYGMPLQMNSLLNLAHHFEIPVIEDAAEAMGSKYNGQDVGTFGTMGIYSFNGNKIITTGGGGALISNNSILIERAKYIATQACDKAPYYQHSELGYNYRMSNVLAAIGYAQLDILPERISQRRSTFDHYRAHLSDVPNLGFQKEEENCFSNRWLSAFAFRHQNQKGIVQKIKSDLDRSRIETRFLWKPLHTQPIFKKYPYYGHSMAEELFNSGLCLPSGSSLTQSQLELIVSRIQNQF